MDTQQNNNSKPGLPAEHISADLASGAGGGPANSKRKAKSILSMTALFVPELKALLAAKRFGEIKPLLAELPTVDIAERFHQFSDTDKILLFKLLSVRRAVEVFESLRLEEQELLLNNLENAAVSQVLNEMAPDDRAKLFKDLPSKVIKRFFGLMKKEEAEDVRELMTYQEGTAGSLMTTDFVELKKEMTARAALLNLQDRLNFEHDLDITAIYITDKDRQLLGVIELQALIKAPPNIVIKDIMQRTDYIKIRATMPQDDVAKHFQHYDLTVAPVVDDRDVLIGVITIDDIIDIMEQETTEDFEKIAAVLPVEAPYMEAGFFSLVWKRSFWLIILVVVQSISAVVLKMHGQTMHNVIALVFFVPLMIAMGGNAGTQSATIIIRSLAMGDIKITDFFKVIFRESLLGICIGLTLAVVGSMVVSLVVHDWRISLIVGISMGINVIWAVIVGASLPMLFRRLKLDPALMSGPMIATIVDVTGLIIYFSVAKIFLST